MESDRELNTRRVPGTDSTSAGVMKTVAKGSMKVILSVRNCAPV